MKNDERFLKVSRRGIYYDLSISPYVFNTSEFTFVFSSAYNLKRFTSYKNLNSVTHCGLKGIIIEASLIGDIREYQRIEKRGFSVYSVKNEKWYSDIKQIYLTVTEV